MRLVTGTAQGIQETDIPDEAVEMIRKQEQQRIREETPDDQLSPARLRLRKLVKVDKPRITTVEIKGEPWHLRALEFAEHVKLGMLTSRDENDMLDLLDSDALTSLVTAMLYVCVAADEYDSADYFGSLGEAREWAEQRDDDVTYVVGQLFTHILRINPKIIEVPEDEKDKNNKDKKSTVAEAEELEKKDESGASDKQASEPSTTPLTESEPSGSTPAASTAVPPTSPSDAAS